MISRSQYFELNLVCIYVTFEVGNFNNNKLCFCTNIDRDRENENHIFTKREFSTKIQPTNQ